MEGIGTFVHFDSVLAFCYVFFEAEYVDDDATIVWHECPDRVRFMIARQGPLKGPNRSATLVARVEIATTMNMTNTDDNQHPTYRTARNDFDKAANPQFSHLGNVHGVF